MLDRRLIKRKIAKWTARVNFEICYGEKNFLDIYFKEKVYSI